MLKPGDNKLEGGGFVYREFSAASPMTPGTCSPPGDTPVFEKHKSYTATTSRGTGIGDLAGQQPGQKLSLGLRYSEIVPAWLPEIASCVVGVLIFTAIIIILRVFDGKRQPDLVLGLTINSILQYLTSFTKICFLVPVTEALCQLRWLWFSSQPRPLIDFEVYDEATRGGVGIFKLMFKLKGILASPLLWLASLLLISGVFTSAVTQQVVSIRSELIASNSAIASAPRASFYSRWTGVVFELEANDALDLEQKILETAYLSPVASVPPLDPNCPSSDCVFPRFGTLGVCASVLPVTNTTAPNAPQILSFLASTTITNANNASLLPGLRNLPRSYLASASVMQAPTYLFDTQITATALADIMLIYTSEPVEPALMLPGDLRFIEVVLHMCVKGYDVKVIEGIKTTRETGSAARITGGAAAGVTSLNAAWNTDKIATLPQVSCNRGVGGLSLSLAPPLDIPGTYGVDLCTALMTSGAVNKFLQGFIALREGDKSVTNGQVAGMILPAVGTALYGGFMGAEQSPERQVQNVRRMAGNVADGLTNLIRAKGASYTNSSGSVLGTTLRETPVVRVRWAWLALLASQLVLALVFLVGTVVATCRGSVQTIKSSTVAGMCALDETVRARLGPVGDVKELAKVAADVKVKLKWENSLRLVNVT